MNFIYTLPIWVLVVSLIALVAIANEIGFRIGRSQHSKLSERAHGVSNSLKASIFGLVALLLGFSYSMTSNRFNERQHLVLDQANAIGTCYLRAGLLSEWARDRIRSELRRFTDARLENFDKSHDPTESQRTSKEMDDSLAKLWSTIEEDMKVERELVHSTQIIPAANQVIDLSATQVWASRNQMPSSIVLLLAICLVISGGLTGHSSGQVDRRHLELWIVLNCILTLVLFAMLDFDRPHRGLIKVNQEPLRELRATMNP